MSERITRLASGLTIATDRVPAARSVAIGVWVAVGSRDEPAELSGVSHFLEHLLFKGTPTRTATDISRVVDRVGGDINAFTSKEYTAYYCRMPRRHGAVGVELLGDVLTNSLIAADDVESERKVILEELAMDDDSPDDVALRALARQLFGDHGLGRDTAGERATVRSIRPVDVREFFTRALPHRRHDGGRRRRRRSRRGRRRGGRRLRRHARGRRPGRAAALPARRIPTSASTTTPSRCTWRSAAGRCGATTPTGKRSTSSTTCSAAGCRAACSTRSGSAAGSPTASTRRRRPMPTPGRGRCTPVRCPSTPARSHRLIRTELDRLVADGITDLEMEVAIGYLTGAYEMGLEDAGARMSRLGGMLATLGYVIPVDEQLARWEARDPRRRAPGDRPGLRSRAPGHRVGWPPAYAGSVLRKRPDPAGSKGQQR